MIDDPFALPTWNLDQALLWISTRDPDFVRAAKDTRHPSSKRETTWLLELLRRSSDDESEALRHQSEVEDALIKALQAGKLKARNDLDPVRPEWFDRAQFEAEGDPPVSILVRHVSAEKMGDLRLIPADLNIVFPTPEAARLQAAVIKNFVGRMFDNAPSTSLDASQGAILGHLESEQDKSVALRSKPSRERATLALDALFGGEVPEAAILPNVVLFDKVAKWLKENGHLAVGQDTVLRAAGRRK